jgi:hypothetical protein
MHVLLTERSSLTAREVVTCLGPLGYHLEVLDPSPLCLARFSRWVRRIHRCPAAGVDPVGYLERLVEVVDERTIEAVLPTHEQAWLLAVASSRLPAAVRVAVAGADAFARVQSKLAFAELLDELRLPQPGWRRIENATDLSGLPFPYWLKAEFGTAGQGVRHVADAASREAAVETLLAGGAPVIAQQHALGEYGQAQGVFDHGRLIAVHTSVQTGVGVGGSAAARHSVDHSAARAHLATLGEALGWHGGLTLDYLHQDGEPSFIECNPRTVEPGNAAASGVNLPDVQLRLTLGEQLPDLPRVGRSGVRTHGTVALLLGAATRGSSRRHILGELRSAAAGRGPYAGREQLTPVVRDPPSALPLAAILGQIILDPARAAGLASSVVAAYSVARTAFQQLPATTSNDASRGSRAADSQAERGASAQASYTLRRR